MNFSFSKDSCVFYKKNIYRERDGQLSSIFSIRVPLDQVSIEPERKSYDAFFQCKKAEKCIIESWKNQTGKVTESKKIDFSSLHIENEKLANEVYDLFHYLQILCDRAFYAGPAGIKWGDKITNVADQLANRFQLETKGVIKNGAIFQQKYKGSFAGFSTQRIDVRFVNGQFYKMAILLDIGPDKSIANTWYNVVKKIIDKYGKPNRIDLPKAIDNIDELINKKFFENFTIFDLEIAEGNWTPFAIWSYKNNAVISVNVVLNINKWEVHWTFYHKELNKLAKAKVEENPIDDF